MLDYLAQRRRHLLRSVLHRVTEHRQEEQTGADLFGHRQIPGAVALVVAAHGGGAQRAAAPGIDVKTVGEEGELMQEGIGVALSLEALGA